MVQEFVSRVMVRLVEAVCEEVNRLYCCIQRMNSNGCVQAWVDIKWVAFRASSKASRKSKFYNHIPY